MHSARLALALIGVVALSSAAPRAQLRLTDETDRAAFRAWFVFLADAQFERTAPDVTDCAALVRYAFREALRAHTPEWVRTSALPFSPRFPDVKSAPRPTGSGWPLFRVSDREPPAYQEFADARTLIVLNAIGLGREVSKALPGDLLYFRQPSQDQPDHLMVMVGRSPFDPDAADWVVYHTGPSDEGPGEVRKVRLATLAAHPAPRWRPVASNSAFVGVFRLAALGAH